MNKQEAILKIVSAYTNLNVAKVEKLIEATNGIGGVSMVNVKGYSSEKSMNTEVANQLINVGASYSNMLDKDIDIYANFNVENVDINKFQYQYIDTNGLTLEQYKAEVKNCLPIALEQLKQGKTRKNDMSADIWLNKVLVFNLNTMKLSVRGQQINKVVETKGEFKVVKSKPLTVAKRLIEYQAKARTTSLRRFALDNLIGTINVNKETIEIS
jgi:hypothetical protein